MLISAGVIGGFLFLHRPQRWERPAWLLPLLIAIFGCLRSDADEQVFRLFGKYIQQIEVQFLGVEGGWEKFRLANPPRMRGGTVDSLWRNTFWGTFLLVAALVACWGFLN